MKLTYFKTGKPKQCWNILSDNEVTIIKFIADKNLSEIEKLFGRKLELKQDRMGFYVELDLYIKDESDETIKCAEFTTKKLRHNQYLIMDCNGTDTPIYYIYSIPAFKQMIRNNNILKKELK